MDATLEPWASRKTRNRSDVNNPKKARAILVDTGHLRRSIGVGVATFDKIEIVTKGITYGHYHNTGDTRDGVKRQFMGESKQLTNKISLRIRKDVNDVLGRK